MLIGDVELPIVSDIEQREQSEVNEIKDGYKHIDSVAVKHTPSIDTLVISGFLNREMHSNSLNIDEQKREFKALRTNGKLDNWINYKDFTGFLLVESVNFSDTSDSRVITEVEIEARYFPWPKYYYVEGSDELGLFGAFFGRSFGGNE